MELEKLADGFNLAEGPVYSEALDKLFFVDINGKCFYSYSDDCGIERFDVDDYCGTLALTSDKNKVLLALSDGVYLYDLTKKEKSLFVKLDIPEGMRCNDGKVAPDGSFFTESMGLDKTRRKNGKLFRITSDKKKNIFNRDFTIPNGLDWYKSRFFHIDTTEERVFEFKLTEDRLEELSSFQYPAERPDGMCVDAEGLCYIALWGSSRISILDFDKKIEVGEIKVPAVNTSCAAFGGRDFTDLYITTATFKDNNESGALYRIKGYKRGLKPFIFPLQAE